MHDIITIGTASQDVFLTNPVFKILNDGKRLGKNGFSASKAQCFALGAKIEIDKLVFSTGGGAANAAVTFSRQGLKSAALIRIGKDESGNSILKEFLEEKITPLVARDRNQITAYSAILLTPKGERTILVYRGASDDLKIKEIPFNKLRTRWVYISPGKISYPVIEKLFNHFSKNKILIAFNPSGYFLEMGIRKLKPLFEKTKVVVLNKEEASFLTGINYKNEKAIFQKLDKLIDGIAVMTQGAKGVFVSDGKQIYSAGTFPVPERKVIDRTGAGDAFASGFVSGLIHKKEKCDKGLCRIDNIKHAIRLGSANATSVIEKIGAKEGILRKSEFTRDKKWRYLPIKILKA